MRELDETEHNKIWDAFEEKFAFHPSVSTFPGIIEPQKSITFQFSHTYTNALQSRLRRRNLGNFIHTRADALIDELASAVIDSFREVGAVSDEIFRLNWGHASYAYNLAECPLGAGFPDGDYEILLSEDMSFGTFGHPWEHSICIFGDQLVKSFLKRRPTILFAVIRNSGGYNVA